MYEALDGIKVLDLSRLLPGPYCSMLLADMGAEVIKIEDPQIGDYIRWMPPMIGNNSGIHVILNRNKSAMKLNLKAKPGREIFLKMVKEADIVLEGFRPGIMDKLGLGYDILSGVNPGIIYCSISGYGATGLLSKKAGHDINFLALSGILSYSGKKDGRPTLAGVQIADIGGGALFAAYSILAAIIARQKSNKGQFIDVSMSDGAMAWNAMRYGDWIAGGRIPSPGDDMLNHGFACYNIYETSDGCYMALGAVEPQFWVAFCNKIERPDLAGAKYLDQGDIQTTLEEELQEVFLKKTRDEWVDFLREVDCCCTPVLTMEEAFSHQHFKERDMCKELKHEDWGTYRQLGFPVKFSKTPAKLKSHAPEHGEHTHRILRELGLTEDEINKLEKDKII